MPTHEVDFRARARHLAKVVSPRAKASESEAFVRSASDLSPEAHKSFLFSAPPPADRREAIARLAAPLIKEFEGYRSEAYLCSAGKWTVGWGTTMIGDRPVYPGLTVSEREAEEYLRRDMEACIQVALAIEARALKKALRHPLTEAQLAALTSWAYNVGLSGALNSGAVSGRIAAGDLEGAANGLLEWCKETRTIDGKKQKVVNRGLLRRREAERALFLSEAVSEPEERDAARVTPDAPERPVSRSTTVWAGLAGMGAWMLDLVEQKFALFSKLTGLPGVAGAVLSVLALSAIAWMIAERIRKARVGGEVGG